jgi:hypothetical protein
MITKMSFGMNDKMASPKNLEMIRCFLMGLISSILILSTIIETINPTVNTQNRMLMLVLIMEEVNSCVIDCNQ